MTLFVDDPELLTCFEGIKTLPSSEVPLLWNRLVVFDDSIHFFLPYRQESEDRPPYNQISVELLVNASPGWQHYFNLIKDASEDPIHKTIYLCSKFAWYQLHLSHPASDFNKTHIIIIPLLESGIFEGFKDGDVVACPSECSIQIQAEVDYWLTARDKAKQIEGKVDGLSLKPYPLQYEDLVDRLVDELRLLNQSQQNDNR